jgi:hypothetical protein
MENDKDLVRDAPPALSLDVEDGDLVTFITAYMKKAEAYFDGTKKIKTRRETNERFYFGRQIDPETRTYKGLTGTRNLKTYEKPYSDNVLKEGEDILRPMILSRLPDLIVKPGTEGNDISRQSAEQITKVVNNVLSSREIKKVLTKAFRHHSLYFTGVIKYRWDPTAGKNGDVVFEAIHPKNILMDHTATENNERGMKIIVHYVEKSIKEWILLFPKKEDVIINYAKSKGAFSEDLDEKSMAVNLKLFEVWFDWFEKEKECDPENPKFKFLSGVCWMAGTKKEGLLDKRMNPNWDWDGTEKLFFNGQPIPDEQIPQIAMLGMDVPGLQREKTYKNFFGKPRKPFIFLGYEQWGEQPLDETTRIEENILLQENYDIRGMQIVKMIDDARGKNVWSSLSGLKRATIQDQDFDDPDVDMFINGEVPKVHGFISREQPSTQMFNDLTRTRDRILAKIHISAPSRGEIQSDVATTNQIARESDFTVADDISNDTVNEVATQMAEALLHMMKLRYTPDHFKAVLGEKGETTFLRFQNDMIEDGMEVDIFASGTDKLKAERQAKDEAQLGLIDPITYYKDTGRSDPEGRAEKLFLFQQNPELYYKKFVKGEDLPDIAEQIMLMNQQKLQMASQDGQGAGQPAQATTMPMKPSVGNTSNIPTTPQGSPRNLMQRAGGAIAGMFGR